MAIILFLISLFLSFPFLRNKNKRSYSAWDRSRKMYGDIRSARNDDRSFSKFIMSREL